jgi:hypothetical protein
MYVCTAQAAGEFRACCYELVEIVECMWDWLEFM